VKAGRHTQDHSEEHPYRSLNEPLPMNQMVSPETEWRSPSECTRSEYLVADYVTRSNGGI